VELSLAAEHDISSLTGHVHPDRMKTFQMMALVAILLIPQIWSRPALAGSGEALVVGADIDAGTLDPRLTTDSTGYRVANLLYSGLVHLTPGLVPEPDLAESWEVPEPTVWVFKLRPNVKFSDGSPLTAEDVVYTYQTITDPKFKAPRRMLYSPIEKIEALDPLTVRFKLSTPYAPLLSYLDLGIVSKAAVMGGLDIGSHPIGAGPMVLVHWARGDSMEFAANPDYWARAPKIHRLTLKIMADIDAEAKAFEAGELDVIQSPLSPQEIGRLAADDKYDRVISAGLGITYLNFNTRDPILADPRMRRALSMLVDQETIVKQIYEGVDQIATSMILPSSWAYSSEIRQPSFNIEQALKLLAEIGWTDSDGDGLLDKDGMPLRLMLSTHLEDPNRVQALSFIQTIFQSVGIDAQMHVTDWSTFSTNYVHKGEHQIALLGWLNIVDPDRLLFAQMTSDGPSNWGGYSNPEVDALLRKGRESLEQTERTKAYRSAARILADELPYYVISYQGYQMFSRKGLPVSVTAEPRGNLRGMIGLDE
jgi:peptide/nickel transport system substrate-binding protein